MATEIEATYIDINKDEIRHKLREAGAELVQAEKLMRRVIFDIDKHSFARVRDEGNKITMSYKHVDSLTLTGTQEICLEVNDYDAAIEFLKALGIRVKADQETLREEWLLDGVEITIDTWPWIPTYMEVEGPTTDSVKSVSEKLGYNLERDAHYGSVDEIYRIYYDVSCEDINYCPEIKFTEIPEWLAKKRKQN